MKLSFLLYGVLACSVTIPLVFSSPPSVAQATSEASIQRAAEDAAAFATWKATLRPEQQAWETILEENLGSFYLPIYYREKRASKVTAWDYVQDDPALPRVLLIGDSISRAYTVGVRQALQSEANVHRAPENCGPTANGLKKLDLWLGKGRWDLIYFNFGIHDRATPIADYERRLEEIIVRLKATGANVVWASSTPVPLDDPRHQPAEAIPVLNAAALRLAEKHQLVVDDLYKFISPHVGATQKPGDVHFNDEGYRLLAHQVSETIRALLKSPGKPQ